MKNNFNKDFLFGAATSAPQTEGFNDKKFKSQSTWDYWYQNDSGLFFENIGPNDTNNTFSMYEEDIKCIKELGINSFRTSISWTRLLPNGYDLNQEAVDFYKAFFEKIKKNNVKLFVNLFHFDMPLWLDKKGGWTNNQAPSKFAYYAKKAFRLFGEYVDYWITFNEPTVHVECSYMKQCHYPAIVDSKQMIQAAFNTILASALAIKEFRNLKLKSKIGIILIMSPVYARSKRQKDLKAKKVSETILVDSFANASIKGTFSNELIHIIKKLNLMPNYEKNDLEIIKKNVVDFIGANYYQPIRVKASKKNNSKNLFENLFEHYDWKKKNVNPHRGWEIYPKGIYDVAKNITKKYPNLPWYVSENGIGVSNEEQFKQKGIINDQYRIDFLKDHLSYLFQALTEIKKNKCFGYHMWTLIDCWSWLNTYKNRYGFFSLDLESKARTIKQSGIWMKNFLKGK